MVEEFYENMLSNVLIIGLLGFATGWIGVYTGMMVSSFMRNKGRRFSGIILGLIGGFTLGIICYDLLPEAFEAGSLYIAIGGITIGLILSIVLDQKLEHKNLSVSNIKENNYLKAAIFMAIGTGIHNFPGGAALGTVISNSPKDGLHLALALIFDGIPEGLTLGIFLIACNANMFRILLISILTSIPMGLGSAFGSILKSPVIICASLSFASAMMLYVTLRETLPLANETWKGKATTLGNVIGLLLGMLLVSYFHQ